jgi:selenocysteine lyase/cysteine desulfurase
LESLVAYRVRPAGEKIPGKWMTGTQAHESIAGTIEAVEYLADLGRRIAGHPVARREALTGAYIAIAEYERRLAATFLEGINRWRDYHILGIRDCNRLTERVPTFSLCHNQNSPAKIASSLARQGICVWHGNFYALEFSEALGLEPDGMVRIGMVHYNTVDEVERLLFALEEFRRS